MKLYIKGTACLLTAFIVLSFVACKDREDVNSTSGVFDAMDIIISAEADGRILSFDVQEGDKVSFGEELGRIDTLQLSLQRAALYADNRALLSSHNSIKTQIAPIEAQLEAAQRERNRFAALFDKGAATQKQLDDLDNQIALLQSQLEAMRQQLSQGNRKVTASSSSVEIQIARLDDLIERTAIKAPANGTVLNKYAEAGEVTSVGRPLLRIADLHNVFLRTYLTGKQLADIRLGQEVTVEIIGGDQPRTYQGRVVHIAEEAEFTPKNIQTDDERARLAYAVKVAVENDGYIKLGLYGRLLF